MSGPDVRRQWFATLRRAVFVAGVALLAGCGSGGCNCTVPAFHAAPTPTPLPPGVTPSPTPTPLPPGVTPSPTPLPPGVTPSPTPTPRTCAQNAIVGAGVPLGTAASFAVLGGAAVTSTGFTIVNGDLGLSPSDNISGFPPGIVNGTEYITDPVAAQAQLDLTTAYNNAAGRAHLPAPADIGGTVIAPGVYAASSSLGITGTVTLDGQNNPNSVFIFQMPTTLTTSIGSSVNLINGANACNVFWQVGSSATINGSSTFAGTVMALTSISLGTGATVSGRVLASNGAVTLLGNTISRTAP